MSHPLPAAVMMMEQRLEEGTAAADVGAEIKARRNRINQMELRVPCSKARE